EGRDDDVVVSNSCDWNGTDMIYEIDNLIALMAFLTMSFEDVQVKREVEPEVFMMRDNGKARFKAGALVRSVITPHYRGKSLVLVHAGSGILQSRCQLLPLHSPIFTNIQGSGY